MNGIVTLLDEPFNEAVTQLWRRLEQECSLSGIFELPATPHFSWQVAEDYDLERLLPVLKQVVQEVQPFTARTSGLGLFTGDQPVLFLTLVKNQSLLDLHALLWEKARQAAVEMSPYYAPQAWIPHITLAHNDTTPEKLHCALQRLAYQSFQWEFTVTNLSVIGLPSGPEGRYWLRFDFPPAG